MVHRCTNAVFTTNFVYFVDLVTVVEDPLGKGRFPRVDVGTNANIPQVSQVSHASNTSIFFE